MTSRPANASGRRRSPTQEGRKRARRADRLERPRLHRQRRRRRQRRERPHVRARRQDRQDRVGVLSRAESPGRPERGPKAASPLDGVDLGKRRPASPITGGATWTSYTLDPPRACSMCRAAIRRRISRPDARQGRISIPARSSCSTPRPAPTRAISSSCRRTGTIGMSRRARDHQDRGRQDAAVGRAEGRASLWLRSRDRRAALPRAGDPDRERRRAVRGRQAGPFLPRLDRRRRMERPGLRPADQPHHGRRGRMVHDRDACSRRRRSPTSAGRAVVGRSLAQPVQHLGQGRPGRATGRAGSTRRRRRHRHMEMAGEDQLSDPERHDADGGRRRLLRRHGRQFLCARRRRPGETLGPENRRRGRRRRHHL